MFVLENNLLRIEIDPFGAEVKRIFDKELGKERLWSGDVKFWGRVSPVLFPIVGRVANDEYLVNGKTYSLGQHGFARDMAFALASEQKKELWFELKDTPETLNKYPFAFILRIGYVLEGATVRVKWEVTNPDDTEMFFSIGAHPAISTDLLGQDALSDYYLHLHDNGQVETYLFDTQTGLIKDQKESIIPDLKLLPLSFGLFEEYPTIILENESEISLKCYNHDHGVNIRFEGFPYVGIWSPIGEEGVEAPFVCIEPWYGMADTKTSPGELKDKKGIVRLGAKEAFKAAYSMEFK
ncbi:MAG: aldose 1-epimerase family protein [Turicibacter sp.]|nr:aldose 1-epimerase family protein [Turicibacter sp.]